MEMYKYDTCINGSFKLDANKSRVHIVQLEDSLLQWKLENMINYFINITYLCFVPSHVSY